MAKLIPLRNVPYRARKCEAMARKAFESRQAATQAARWEIVDGPGTYSGPFPFTIGLVVTREAAQAVAGQLTHMPGGTSHHPY